MRALIQRVSFANVVVENETVGEIKSGLLVLLGIESGDNDEDLRWIVQKTSNMRIFNDEAGKMNCSVKDIEGETLVVSQFTLHASTKKGNRPSFIRAARPEIAEPLYNKAINLFKQEIKVVEKGIFGADMKVGLLNDGPVTIWLDSKNKE